MKNWIYRNLPAPVIAGVRVFGPVVGIVGFVGSLALWPHVIGPIIVGIFVLVIAVCFFGVLYEGFENSMRKAKYEKQDAWSEYECRKRSEQQAVQKALEDQGKNHAEQLRLLSDKIAALNKEDKFQEFISK